MTELLRKFEPSDVIALAGVLVAGLALALTELRIVLARRAADRQERQRQAGEAVGPVMALLDDTHPDRLAFNVDPRTVEHRQRTEEHWRSSVRGPLLAVAVGYPTAEVRDLARQLARQVAVSLHIGYERALDLLNSRDSPWSHEEARQEHQRALDLAEDLATRIRGERSSAPTSGTPSG